MASTELRLEPLLLCCRKENWDPRSLRDSLKEGESNLDLLVCELDVLRTEGRHGLAKRLVAAAAKQGVVDQRLSPPSKAAGPRIDADAAKELLKDLRRVCLKAGLSDEALAAAEGQDEAALKQACFKQMQAMRLQGHHRTVVALGRRAIRAGLDHPRIRNNLERSERLLRHQRVMDTVQKLLAGKRSAREKAEQLMVEAITDDPDFHDCRQQLLACLKERLGRRSEDPFRDELLEARVGLELNRRRLELLEQRLLSTKPQSISADDQASPTDG